MVITILEAHVAHDRAQELERAFREQGAELPPGLLESFLVRDTTDGTLFQVISVWESQAALDRMRASVEKPKGVQFFEAAGVSPQLAIRETLIRYQR